MHALVVLLGLLPQVAAVESPIQAENLRCEYRVDPLGIDVLRPRLSWTVKDDRRSAVQTAYQILVASSRERLEAGEADLWDSGKVASGAMNQIEYGGKPLESRMECYWKVRLWDAEGKCGAYSAPAKWTMGLLRPGDFQAKWVGLDGPMLHPAMGDPLDFDGCRWVWYPEKSGDAKVTVPAGKRYFRGYVTIPDDGRRILRARFLITADDAFEMTIDGKPAGRGSAWNAPQVAEATHRLHPGKNLVSVMVTNGSDSPAGLIGKLVVDFDHGESFTAVIDETWRASDRAQAGWNQTGFDDSAWPHVKAVAEYGAKPWGTLNTEGLDNLACPLFRKEFAAPAGVRRATLYVSALGNYDVEINGRRVADHYFSPGWTDYNKRVYYDTYDVTDLVDSGGLNAVGVTLAAGWYAGAIGWKSERFHYGKDPKFWLQLELENADGSRRTIVSDETWKTAFGPILEGEFLAGETYDARLEIPGWSSPGLDDGDWNSVKVTPAISAQLQAQPGVPVIQTGTLHPKTITEPKPGVFVFDMGQNFAGFVRLKVSGPKGTRVVMRFAERLNDDGTIYTTNLRGARATDTYILKGEGEEIWQPRFTFHGFQYVELTGYPGTPTKDTVTGIAINSDTPLVGKFSCSSEMVNKLYSNIVWTQRANFISVPTDCPQRDERLGWMGDAQVFIRAATYNADVAAFFTKWLVDVEDAQTDEGAFTDVSPRVVAMGSGTAAWADAGVICPWTIYEVYGDKRVLAKHLDAMERWVAYCESHSTNLLRPAQGYGDWLSVNADTPKDVLATAYFAYSTYLTAKAAETLGQQDKAEKYMDLFHRIKKAFNEAYVDKDGRIKGNTQTCYVLALWFDLLPDELRPKAAEYLVDDIRSRDWHLSTGFVGTSVLMPTLSATGNTDVAYRLLLNDTYPSWGYSIKYGATSIWERWDGWTAEKGFQNPGMNSFAHYSFGAVARWMFQSAAGIDTDGPGFRKILIRPQLGPGIDWVDAEYGSICGKIADRWEKTENGVAMTVTIPANTVATVCVPTHDPASVTEGGVAAADASGVTFLRQEPGYAVFRVGSGTYRFKAK
ncbi:family 78 glycoside hydrolase catalytic domain [Thermostilla marina]